MMNHLQRGLQQLGDHRVCRNDKAGPGAIGAGKTDGKQE